MNGFLPNSTSATPIPSLPGSHDATSASIWSRGSLHPLPKGTLLGIPSDPESVRGLLDDDEVAALERRCHRLLADPVMPAPHAHGPAIPWPPF